MTIDGPRLPPADGGSPKSLVILLHGYGSNGEDLIGLGAHWRSILPHTAFVAPNAPEPCPGAFDGYQWWALTSLDRSARVAGARRAAPGLEAFIDAELAATGVSAGGLALVGFSQGTMMALQVGLRRFPPPAGVIGYSGMLADEGGLETLPPGLPPILLIHGEIDPTIPVAALHRTEESLVRHGFLVETHISPGTGHSIDPSGLQLGGRFLSRVLGSTSS